MAEPAQKSSRQRSPNYPSINLEDAITRIKVIYDAQRRNPADREVFAKILGYKGLNGASIKVISSLSKYGLLEGSGEGLRVSSIGEDLALHRPGDTEFFEAVQVAGGSPAFFRDLNLEYPDGLPSDHAIRATLIKRGFHPQAVEPALQSYRDTLEYLARFEAPAVDDQPDEGERSSQREDSVDAPSPPQHRGHISYSIPIAPNSKTIVVSGPFPVSRGEWEQFQKVLAAFEPALVSDEAVLKPAVSLVGEQEDGRLA